MDVMMTNLKCRQQMSCADMKMEKLDTVQNFLSQLLPAAAATTPSFSSAATTPFSLAAATSSSSSSAAAATPSTPATTHSPLAATHLPPAALFGGRPRSPLAKPCKPLVRRRRQQPRINTIINAPKVEKPRPRIVIANRPSYAEVAAAWAAAAAAAAAAPSSSSPPPSPSPPPPSPSPYFPPAPPPSPSPPERRQQPLKINIKNRPTEAEVRAELASRIRDHRYRDRSLTPVACPSLFCPADCMCRPEQPPPTRRRQRRGGGCQGPSMELGPARRGPAHGGPGAVEGGGRVQKRRSGSGSGGLPGWVTRSMARRQEQQRQRLLAAGLAPL